MEELLTRLKQTLILDHNEDDALLRSLLGAALDYAHMFQKRNASAPLLPSAEQAVVMLAAHWYESRDGSTGGFFADNTHAADSVWRAVHRLLAIGKEWDFG